MLPARPVGWNDLCSPGDGGDLFGDCVNLLVDGVNLLGDSVDLLCNSIAGGSSKKIVAQKCSGTMEIQKYYLRINGWTDMGWCQRHLRV